MQQKHLQIHSKSSLIGLGIQGIITNDHALNTKYRPIRYSGILKRRGANATLNDAIILMLSVGFKSPLNGGIGPGTCS